MANWQDIEKDPDYQALSDVDKQDIKKSFFEQNVSSDPDYLNLPDADKQEIQTSFLGVSPQVPAEQATPPQQAPIQEEIPLAEQMIYGGMSAISPIGAITLQRNRDSVAPTIKKFSDEYAQDIERGVKAAPAGTITYSVPRAALETAGVEVPNFMRHPAEQPRTFPGRVAQGVTTMLLDSPYYVAAGLAAAPTGGGSITAIAPQAARTAAAMFAPEFTRSYTSKIESGQVQDDAMSILKATAESAKEASQSAAALTVAPMIGKAVGAPVAAKAGTIPGKVAEIATEAAGFTAAHGFEDFDKVAIEIAFSRALHATPGAMRRGTRKLTAKDYATVPEISGKVFKVEMENTMKKMEEVTGLPRKTIEKMLESEQGTLALEREVAERRTAMEKEQEMTIPELAEKRITEKVEPEYMTIAELMIKFAKEKQAKSAKPEPTFKAKAEKKQLTPEGMEAIGEMQSAQQEAARYKTLEELAQEYATVERVDPSMQTIPELFGDYIKKTYDMKRKSGIAEVTKLPQKVIDKKMQTEKGRQEIEKIVAVKAADKANDITKMEGVETQPFRPKVKVGEIELQKSIMESDLKRQLDTIETDLDPTNTYKQATAAVEKRMTEAIATNPAPALPDRGRDTKAKVRMLKDMFTTGWGETVKNNTYQGQEAMKLFENGHKQMELTAGKGVAEMAKLLDYKEIPPAKREMAHDYVVDFSTDFAGYLDPKAKKTEYKKMFTEAEIKKLEARALKIRQQEKITALDDARKIGLTEIDRSVQKWDIKAESKTLPNGKVITEHVVLDRFGREMGRFASDKEAREFKKSRIERPITEELNYWDRVIDFQKVEKDLAKGEQSLIVKFMRETKQIPEDAKIRNIDPSSPDFINFIKDMIEENRTGGQYEAREGNLQYSRTDLELPREFYDYSPEMKIASYRGKLMRVERAKQFGVRDEKLYSYVERIGREASGYYGYDVAKDIALSYRDLLDTVFGKNMERRSFQKMGERAVSDYVVTSFMTLSQIGQIPQFAVTAQTHGLKSFAQNFIGGEKAKAEIYKYTNDIKSALKEAAGGNKAKEKELALQTGLALHQTKSDLLNSLYGEGSIGSWFLKKNKMAAMDIMSREMSVKVGAIDAYNNVKAMSKSKNKYTVDEFDNIFINGKPAEQKSIGHIKTGPVERYRQTFYKDPILRKFQREGIDPSEIIRRHEKTGKWELTKDDIISSAWEAEFNTNFRGRANELPEIRKYAAGRILTALNSFNFLQTSRVIRDTVYSEARFMNFKPLVALITLGPLTGSIPVELRALIKGQTSPLVELLKDPDGLKAFKLWLRYAAAAGTLGMSEMVINSFGYGEAPLGPLYSRVKGLMTAEGNMMTRSKNKLRPVAVEALAATPIVGQIGAPWLKKYYKDKDEKERRQNTSPMKERSRLIREYKKSRGIKPGEEPTFSEKWLP